MRLMQRRLAVARIKTRLEHFNYESNNLSASVCRMSPYPMLSVPSPRLIGHHAVFMPCPSAPQLWHRIFNQPYAALTH